MTHDELVAALRQIDSLQDVGAGNPNFQFRSRPFLHFHTTERGIYADVRFGTGDFEQVWASTPGERADLIARVYEHVERLERTRKVDHRRGRRVR